MHLLYNYSKLVKILVRDYDRLAKIKKRAINSKAASSF